MGIKVYRATSPGRRDSTSANFDGITRSTPEKSLLKKRNAKAGRNNYGRITVRRRGGGGHGCLWLVAGLPCGSVVGAALRLA